MSLALCIPAYNAEQVLPRLLHAAVNQTQSFDEIWVYNDASTDKTKSVALAWGARVVSGVTNVGCSAGKNILAEKTACDWIHFHDADDSLSPMFVEAAHSWIRHGDAAPDVVLFAYEMVVDGSNARLGTRRFDNAELKIDPLGYAIREQINPFCGLYRRDALLVVGGYDTDPQVLYNEDVAFHIRLAERGLRFDADDRVVVINFCRASSMSSSNQVKCVRAQFHVLRKLSATLREQRRLGAYSSYIATRLWHIADVAAAFSDWDYVDGCIELARELGSKYPSGAKLRFQWLATIAPHAAYRIREYLIRRVKRRLRAGYPSV